ncbi:MAG: FprA family A-type flavoprotein [Bacteroidaceae bacterium]|nr:FprA family A-type flavoprotein [Bacteroidaceae bacterium]
MKISTAIKYIGVYDRDIDLFEGQYRVPQGISYNSYMIIDEKIAIIDTADARKGTEWWKNLLDALDGRTPDYLVSLHMEPDHSSLIAEVMERFPTLQVVATPKALQMMPRFFEGVDFAERGIPVKEGDTLSLGSHELTFVHAPMVHWPEVMVCYESSEKVLFSADAFGYFGAPSLDGPWDDEARRYYINICGKYGAQVQTLLKKASQLDIDTICPLHGPVLKENLSHYLSLYDTWSSYRPECDGVFIPYASIYGGTAAAAHRIADLLRERGVQVIITDLARCDMSKAVSDAFRMSRMIVCAASYDAGVFTPMHDFLYRLKIKGFRNRRVGIVENGSWAPTAGRVMRGLLEEMKNIDIIPTTVTISSRMKAENSDAVAALVESI